MKERPEIVCVWPFWSQSGALNWDSNYAYLRIVLPELIRERPTWRWVVLWPQLKGKGAWKWYDDKLFNDERVIRYPWPYPTAMQDCIRHFDVHAFHQLEADYSPTLYWMHQVEAAAQIVQGTVQSFSHISNPAVVAQHHYIIHKSLPAPMFANHTRRLLQTIGTIAAHRVVLNSEHTHTMMRESFAELLSDDQMTEIEAKTSVERFGLIDDALSKDVKAHDRPVIIYNHRFETYKQPRITARVLERLRKEHDFEVWISQYVGQSKSRFPVDRVVGHPERGTYLENIAVPAINTLNSLHETFCIAMLDSIALGHLPVAPNSVTFPELVPPGYPYLFENEKDQTAMLDRILAEWPAAYNEWSPKLRAWARAEFTVGPYAKRYAQILDETARAMTSTPKPHTLTRLDAAYESIKGRTLTLKTLHKQICKAVKLGDQAFTPRRALREAADRGATFSLESGTVRVTL